MLNAMEVLLKSVHGASKKKKKNDIPKSVYIRSESEIVQRRNLKL